MSGLLNNTKIRTRMSVVFALMLSCTVGLGLFAMHRLDTSNEAVVDLSENWLPSSQALGVVALNVARAPSA